MRHRETYYSMDDGPNLVVGSGSIFLHNKQAGWTLLKLHLRCSKQTNGAEKAQDCVIVLYCDKMPYCAFQHYYTP